MGGDKETKLVSKSHRLLEDDEGDGSKSWVGNEQRGSKGEVTVLNRVVLVGCIEK